MYTVKETALFQRKAASVLSESELDDLFQQAGKRPDRSFDRVLKVG